MQGITLKVYLSVELGNAIKGKVRTAQRTVYFTVGSALEKDIWI